MYTGTLYRTESPSIEVRIYRDDRLVVREICQSREDAAAIAEQASDRDHVYLLVEGACSDRGPGDVITREAPRWATDEDQPLASAELPGYGTE